MQGFAEVEGRDGSCGGGVRGSTGMDVGQALRGSAIIFGTADSERALARFGLKNFSPSK